MKKMLLLLVSGLLLVCMAGSAMAADSNAGNIVFVSTSGDLNSIITKPITMDFTDTKTIYAACNSYSVGTKTYNVGVTRTDDPNGDIHLSATPSSSFSLTFATGETWKYQPLVLKMENADPNEVYEITVGDEIYKVAVTTEVTTVPEFPTVALPVAALIGLVFIFGRKKEGL